MSLLSSYITTAFRNLARNRTYALINLTGMTVGLTAVVLLVAAVDYEMGYDRHHANGDRLYRVLRRTTTPDGTTDVSTSVSGALRTAALETLPQVADAVRVWDGRGTGTPYIGYDGTVVPGRFWYVERNFLDVFDFPLLTGDAATVFDAPHSVVITESAVTKWFGDTDPIGKTLCLEHTRFGGDYVVTGILEDPPAQSSFRFEMLTADIHNDRGARGPWEQWSVNFAWIPVQTWLLLREGADLDALDPGLQELMTSHLGAEIASTDQYHLQALHRVHLHQNADFGIPGRADIRQIELITGVVVLLLAIACVNFTNLSAARALTRAKEVGVRKVVGARRLHLLFQFTTEAITLSLLGLIVALALAKLSVSVFAELIGSEVVLNGYALVHLLPFLVVVTVLSGLLAGIYPALLLSSLSPSAAVRPGYTPGSSRALMRKGLVLFQFTVSTVLLIGVLSVREQMTYVTQKDLGFDRENIVLLPIFGIDRGTVKREGGPYTRRYNQVKEAFLAHPRVLAASASHSTVGWGGLQELLWTEQQPEGKRVRFMAVDEDYIDTYGIRLISGRGLDGNRERDKLDAFILNETAASQLGWTAETALGQPVGWPDKRRKGNVIGVVADFHNRTLEEPIGPVVLAMWQPKWNTLSLRISPDDVPGTIADLEDLWNRFLPTRPFWYQFLDQNLDNMYRETRRFQTLASLFAGLAALVACIGLVGLVSFTIERKTKEIGVRKVLGASDAGLIGKLLGAQIRPVLYANLIAWPIASTVIDDLLSEFAYRVDIGWSTYLAGSLAIVYVAIAAVFFHVYHAARRDPVETLRYE